MTDPSNFVNQHADRWTIPESMVEYEKKIAALERERDESRKWAEAQARFINKLEAENVILRKRLEPIEKYWDDLQDRFTAGVFPHEAIKKCMSLKDSPESNGK